MSTLPSTPAWLAMAGLPAPRVNDALKVSVNVDGRDGADVDTPPVKENFANGNFAAAGIFGVVVLAEETAAVEATKAATPAPARMIAARADGPSLLIDPPSPSASPHRKGRNAAGAAAC